MEIKGYIRLSRKFFENSLWTEPRVYSRAEAWLDLIQMARFESTTEFLTNRAIEVGRGEIPVSRRFLEKRWQWSNTKVDNFLKALQKRQQISQRNASGQSIITLCNYDTYNPINNAKNAEEEPLKTPTERQQNANETPTKKNLKKENNLKEKPPKGGKKKSEAVASTLSLNSRKDNFFISLQGYVSRYGERMIREFFDYWAESNKSQTKMRFELQPTWETPKRLATWANKDKDFQKIAKNGLTKQSATDRLHFGGSGKNYDTEPTIKFEDGSGS